MASHELEQFITSWEFESKKTQQLLAALPKDQYDFRPDAKGRSLGELAWHLAEIDGYMSHGIATGSFADGRPPGLERPRAVAELAPGYARVHGDAKTRLAKLTAADLDRQVKFFGDRVLPVRHVLWSAMLQHLIHHRGQLVLLCRLAGGKPPGLYGPTREETLAMRARAKA